LEAGFISYLFLEIARLIDECPKINKEPRENRRNLRSLQLFFLSRTGSDAAVQFSSFSSITSLSPTPL
jgi:hypothetical protein